MNSKRTETPPGIAGLSKTWRDSVQIVSTFGLAVFLVLYYVLFVRKEDSKRYEDLRASVNALVTINERQGSLISPEVERRLEAIYLDAVSGDVARIIELELKRNKSKERLVDAIRKALVAKTSLVNGLYRRDGRSVSEVLLARIQNFDLPDNLAQYALDTLAGSDSEAIDRETRSFLQRNFSFIASAK